MAPKAKPAKFVFAVGTKSIILAVVTCAMAQPSLSLIYRPELLLLY
jgi:hypothetical protein